MTTTDLVERVDKLDLNTSSAARIQRLVERNAPPREVRKVVAVDAVLAARVLKLANSAVNARARPVATLEEGMVRVGMRGVCDLAWSLALHTAGTEHRPHGPRLQAHAVEVAAACQLLDVRGISPSQAFVVGLLHDIGAQLLLAVEPQAYGELLDRVGFDSLRLHVEEKKVFGIDHASVAAEAMRGWGIPESVAKAVEDHHTVRALSSSRDPDLQLAALIHQADAMVGRWRETVTQPALMDELAEAMVKCPVNRHLQLRPIDYRNVYEGLPRQIARLNGVVGA